MNAVTENAECLSPHIPGTFASVCEGEQLTLLNSTALAFPTANWYRFYVSCASPASIIAVTRCQNTTTPGLPTHSLCSPASTHMPACTRTPAHNSWKSPWASSRGNRARVNLSGTVVSQLPYALTKLPTAAASPGSAFIISPSPSSGGNSFSPMLDFH